MPLMHVEAARRVTEKENKGDINEGQTVKTCFSSALQ